MKSLYRTGAFTLTALLFALVAMRQRRAAGPALLHAAIVESSQDAIVGIRLDGTIISWNPGAERLYGYSAREIRGRSILTLAPTERQPEVAGILAHLGRGEQITYLETERVDINNHLVDIAVTASPIRNRAGKIIGAAAIIRDVSARKRAEEALSLLSSAVEQTDDSVIITDRAGIIEYVNSGFEKLTGYTRAEVLGRTPRLLKSERHSSGYYADLWRVILSGQVFRAVIVNRKKNRELYYEEKTITPILDKHGQIAHFLSTGKDITERVRAYQTLEQEVEERTAELARLYRQAEQTAMLEERQRLARELHDSVAQSLYSLTLLAESGQRMAAAGDLPQVQHNVARLTATARQALREMRLLVYELRPTELAQTGLIGALRQRLDAVEERGGIQTHLEIEDDPDLPGPLAQELYRIAVEALNNSLKHAFATSVSVHLSCSGDMIELQIEDNGRGFDAAAGNSGLGLRSMHERVERLGGQFIARSIPGEGTVIIVRVNVPPYPLLPLRSENDS